MLELSGYFLKASGCLALDLEYIRFLLNSIRFFKSLFIIMLEVVSGVLLIERRQWMFYWLAGPSDSLLESTYSSANLIFLEILKPCF